MAAPYYYVPAYSVWPILTATAVFCTLVGFINIIHDNTLLGTSSLLCGITLLLFVILGWFHSVISESRQGLYSPMTGRSFRWGMVIFIVSEVMLFATFFGALFYARAVSVPFLGGIGEGHLTNLLLWPDFQAAWPLFNNPDPQLFPGQQSVIGPVGIPLLNTFLLLSSAGTLTIAHWALKVNKREWVVFGLLLTIVLGLTFLGCQVYEYVLAYTHDKLTLGSGIYGTTFFMLTGFHGAHVTLGAIMLICILIRILRGHFSGNHHFGFEACAWYWHFVDVVWLFLFVFVYWV